MRRLKRSIPLCECGCGKETKWNNYFKRFNRFINYHNSKIRSKEVNKKISNTLKGNIPWNKGKTGIYSKETLNKISKAGKGIPAWNKGLTKETDERIAEYSKKVSETQKGKKPNKNQLKGLESGRHWKKGLTKETDIRVANAAKKTGDALRGRKNPEHSKRMIKFYKKYPEKHPNYICGQKANAALGKKTYIEEIFGNMLIETGINAKYNYHVGRYWIDYALPIVKIGFECDGEHWHKDKDYDDKRDSVLKEEYGWEIIRFTGKEINHNINYCREIVKGVIKG